MISTICRKSLQYAQYDTYGQLVYTHTCTLLHHDNVYTYTSLTENLILQKYKCEVDYTDFVKDTRFSRQSVRLRFCSRSFKNINKQVKCLSFQENLYTNCRDKVLQPNAKTQNPALDRARTHIPCLAVMGPECY